MIGGFNQVTLIDHKDESEVFDTEKIYINVNLIESIIPSDLFFKGKEGSTITFQSGRNVNVIQSFEIMRDYIKAIMGTKNA
tara:strand:+ start:104 stop:346 length:243 start_codon:yes stop_codon:yes gene_type:complete